MRVPPKVSLARLATPLEPLPRASAALGVELLLKRDDLTGAALSGNKVRKLEYLLAEALALGADTVITCGGEQSNHARATAMAAAQLGLRCVLVLRTELVRRQTSARPKRRTSRSATPSRSPPRAPSMKRCAAQNW